MAIVSMVNDSGKQPAQTLDTNITTTPVPEPNSLDHALGFAEPTTNNTNNNDNDIVEKNQIDSRLDTDTSCPAEPIIDENGQSVMPPEIPSYGPKYDWSPQDKSLIFSAFFATYVIFQIPAARLAEIIGPKWILATAALGSSLISFASPWSASIHVYALIFVRALMGICQAALYPACYVLFSKWLPPVERSLATPVLGVGAYIGSIIASSLTGLFSEQEHFGWQFAFYTPGVVCAIWFALWFWLGSNEPRQHKSISLEELDYIESRMEDKTGATLGGAGSGSKKQISWSKLLTSRSIWAMVVAFFASGWSFTIVLLLLPSYLNNILHIPHFKNGLINSIIYGLFCISSPIVGSVSTMIIETRAFGLTRLNTRKLFQCTALFSQTLCFIALPLIGCNQNWVLGTLFLQIVLYSLINGGEVHLPTELSVDYSGTIYAIGNCIGSSTGFLVPMLHSAIVTEPRDRAQWDMFFYVAALICSLGGLIFLLFGQNNLQDFSTDLGESQLDICHMNQKDASSFSLSSIAGPSNTGIHSGPPGTYHQRTVNLLRSSLQPHPQQRPQNQSTAPSRAGQRPGARWMESAVARQQHESSVEKL